MKKVLAMMLGTCMLMTCCIAGCTRPDNPEKEDPPTPSTPGTVDETGAKQTDRASINFAFNNLYNENTFVDKENGFETADDVKSARFFVAGDYYTTFTEMGNRQDVKLELYNDNAARMVNVSGGMEFTIPTSEDITVDYTLAKYRTQYTFGDVILTASPESGNPYTALSNGWYVYINEWAIRHLVNDTYLTNQNIVRTNPLNFEVTPVGADKTSDGERAYPTVKNGDLTMRPGYEIYRFDLEVQDAGDMERPFYNIGIVHEVNDKINAAFFVMKGKEDHSEMMDKIVMSWNRITKKGTQKNYFNGGTPKIDPHWNEETTAFFNQFMTQKTKSWGVFSYSMPGEEENLHPGEGSYDSYLNASRGVQNFIEETVWGGKKYDVYMTYTHLGNGAIQDDPTAKHYEDGYDDHRHHFPLDMATALAAGNGTNGKPVLEFTYQFTTNNNLVDQEISPMFDILRGKYDKYFERLGQDIKAYGAPVMFRLNNEMNTDWTSYSGIMNFLDPDIFTMTWRRLYDIFMEQGCDNIIWVWNPIADSCPYSGWGEDLCYFPGVDYVQLLGGTSYEFNNYTGDASTQMEGFRDRYSKLYSKNKLYFKEYGMIIGEFACGSGGAASGELGRNRAAQAKWVRDMFTALNDPNPEEYVNQIKGLIWFNCNDYVGDTITNRLRFAMPSDPKIDIFQKKEDYSDLQATWDAFKQGFEDAKKLGS